MTQKNLFIPVSKEFHQQIKEYCVKKEISISELVTKVLRLRIKRYLKAKPVP